MILLPAVILLAVAFACLTFAGGAGWRPMPMLGRAYGLAGVECRVGATPVDGDYPCRWDGGTGVLHVDGSVWTLRRDA